MSTKYDIVPSDSAVTGVPMVRIEAPATLSPGFRFDALYDGQTFSVTVVSHGSLRKVKLVCSSSAI